MKVELLDHLPPELDAFAYEDAGSSFYQTSAWIESLTSVFPHMTPACLLAADSGENVGCLPFVRIRKGPLEALWSMPFGTYGGVLARGREDVASILVSEFFRLGSSPKILEVGIVDFFNVTPCKGADKEQGTTQLIDLSVGFEEIWRNHFEKSKRRQARRGEREGLRIVDAATTAQVNAYYRVYRERMDSWKSGFIYPEELFAELIRRGKDSVKLHLVCKGDLILGGHMNFYFRDSVTAWNGVTRNSREGYQASTFLYAKLIERACEMGYKRFNLGGSLGKASLRRYKAELGGVDYGYRILRRTTFVGKLIHKLKAVLSG